MAMNWKQSFRSIYFDGAPEPADLDLRWAGTVFLKTDRDHLSPRPEGRDYFYDGAAASGPKVHGHRLRPWDQGEISRFEPDAGKEGQVAKLESQASGVKAN
jgi:hypothetical protein